MFAIRHTIHWPIFAILALLLPLVAACGSTDGQGGSTTTFPMQETAEGFTVSLESVDATQKQTLVTIEVRDADLEAGPELRKYEGLLGPRDLKLDGLDFAEGNDAGSTTAIKDESSNAEIKPIVGYRHEIPLASVADGVQDVGITVETLRFEAEDVADPPIVVEGNWNFEFDISALPSVKSATIDVSETKRLEDVAFTVESIEIDPEETLVTYVLDADTPGFVEKTNLVAQFADATFKTPISVENDGNRHVAHFAPLPTNQPVTFVMPSVVMEVQEPISISFPVETPLDGEQIIDQATTIAGEALRVVNVTNKFPESAAAGPAFLVRIENDAAGQNGRILPGMPVVEQNIQATDNLGNKYAGHRAATNLESADAATSWAGGSSFTFDGELPAGVTDLTVSLDSYGKVVGPFKISVDIPGTDF